MKTMSELPARESVGFAADPIPKTIERLKQAAVRLAHLYDFGFPPSYSSERIGALEMEYQAATAQRALTETRSAPGALREPSWGSASPFSGYQQSVRHAVGALLISGRTRPGVCPEDRPKAFRAMILYQHLLELLDDIIDSGIFSSESAQELYRVTLQATTERPADSRDLTLELARLVPGDQRCRVVLAAEFAEEIGRLIAGSPRAGETLPSLVREHDQLAEGQSLTVWLRDPTFHLERVRSASLRFRGPDADLAWHERWAKFCSHVTALSLINRSFVRPEYPLDELSVHLSTWYYLDCVIAELNHLVDMSRDLAGGGANFALVALRESELDARSSVTGYQPHLRMEDYDRIFVRLSELSARAVRVASSGRPDAALFTAFLASMIPVVMATEWTGAKEDLLHAYLRPLSRAVRNGVLSERFSDESTVDSLSQPDYHSTRYSQQASPFRTHRIFVTRPETPLALKTPS